MKHKALFAISVAIILAIPVASLTQFPQRTTSTSTIGKDRDVFTVIAEFNVQPHQQLELSKKIQQLVTDIVSKQPGFLAAHLHLSTDSTKVLNYLQWKNPEAFNTFRQNEELQSQIRPVVGPYGLLLKRYLIVFSAVAQ
jgi:quinol monooxygenase YgiN